MIMRVKQLELAVFLALFVTSPEALLASGYEFDGVGGRNVARGGAVIADAADWTAIYWNPANLADVPAREAGVELRTGRLYSKDGNSLNTPLGNPFGDNRISAPFFLGSIGGAMPLNERESLGFGLYIPLLQGLTFNNEAGVPVFYRTVDYKGYAAIGVGNISYARKMSDKLSCAAGIDVIYGVLESKAVSDFAVSPLTFGPDIISIEQKGRGTGLEGVIGVKYKKSSSVYFGAVLRTGGKVRIRGRADAVSAILPAEKSDFKFTLKHPPTSGVGMAWSASGKLRLSADFSQTWWKGFSNKLEYAEKGGILLRDQPNTFDWKNAYKVRFGGLLNYSEHVDVLFGYAFDTPAIDKDSIDLATAVDVPMSRISAGITHKWSNMKVTLSGLAGSGRRTAGGVKYSLTGWYFMGEAVYSF